MGEVINSLFKSMTVSCIISQGLLYYSIYVPILGAFKHHLLGLKMMIIHLFL